MTRHVVLAANFMEDLIMWNREKMLYKTGNGETLLSCGQAGHRKRPNTPLDARLPNTQDSEQNTLFGGQKGFSDIVHDPLKSVCICK